MLESVRARLTLWYSAILALVLVVFSGISYVLLDRATRAATDASVSDTAHQFANAFATDAADLAGAPAILTAFRYSDREVILFSASGQIVAASPPRVSAVERARIAAAVRNGARAIQTIPGGPEGDGIRMVAVPIEPNGRRYTVVVARDLDEQADRLESAAHAVFFGIPLALLIAAGGGYLLARKSLAPVAAMSVKARQIGAETLSERITVEHERDELGLLASTLNELLERLERAFTSQRRFMADASHELRTPVSIILGESDVALNRERSAAEYRDSLQVIRNSARKLTRMVQDLFLLVRSDAGNYPIRTSRFYVDEAVRECVREMRSIAAARGITLTSDVPQEIALVADEALVQRMLVNLVDNAIKFSPSGGSVRVGAERSGAACLIRVTDTGPGIAAEDQPRVFERFYRVDAARTSSPPGAASGAGLGLPIARWIAGIHGGSLSIEESSPRGTTFVVSLPAAEDTGAPGRMSAASDGDPESVRPEVAHRR